MLSSLFSVAFFGFLRVSEYASTPTGHTINLTGCKVKGECLQISIPSSKFSQLRNTILLQKYGYSTICLVRGFQRYLKTRPRSTSPFLYLLSDASPITAPEVASYLKKLTETARYKGITTHSFRIGGATWAAAKGWSDASIRSHRRWRSNAFMQHVRPA